MNRIYRLIWSQVLNTWVAVSENAKGRGKSGSARKCLVGAMVLISPLALAAPTGGQISAGSGAISQVGINTTITQNSQNLAINWQSFGIAANESVRFNQPNSTAIALNRVLGQDPSQILGSLSSNGQIFVLNPNGVLFGAGSQVNVGGMVASTLSLSDVDFMAGRQAFNNSGTASSVVNQGTLNAASGGYIALLAPEVRNEGIITATLGKALLAAGDKITLNLNNGSLLSYNIDQGSFKALADNKQLIQADGGQVILSAKAANAISTAVVNNTGIIEAHTLQKINGTIKLLGDMQTGKVIAGGTLDARAPDGGNGGFIETSAAHVNVLDKAIVTTAAAKGKAGTWLIDPVDFTIAATGGDMTGAVLANSLGLGNVSIQSSNGTAGTAGDVNVNDVVTWFANQLTLNAQNNININANLNGSGTASLSLQYGQGALAAGNMSTYILGNGALVNLPAGNNFSTLLGSDGVVKNYTVITSLGAETDATTAPATATLQGMAAIANLGGNYVLGTDINAAQTFAWNTSAGFTPIGNAVTPFSGTFDGLGHTISHLTVNLPTTSGTGLFGYTSTGSVIQNVGLVGGSVSGASYVGGLVGRNFGLVGNTYATGNVSGSSYVGGLVGSNYGTISKSYATVSNSFATGNVSGLGNKIGGLVGANYGLVSNSYASGNVSGSSQVGGLVGANYGTVNNSFATGGAVGAGNYVGGLVGYNFTGGNITNSYATGSVSGTGTGTNVGGLVGYNLTGGNISNSFATGSVAGIANVGGLVGYNNNGSVINSFWNITTSGQASSAGGTGLNSVGMMTMSNFVNAGWSIANIGGSTSEWRIYDGNSMPLLRSFLAPVTVTANGLTKTYDGLAYTGTYGVTYSNVNAVLSGAVAFSGSSHGAVNAGSYNITPLGLYSNQQGYDISYANGTLTISQLAITLTGNKVYDGTSTFSMSQLGISNIISGDTLSLSGGSANTSDKNVGTNKPFVSFTGLTLTGASSGNYTVSGVSGTGTITPLALTGTISSGNSTYGASLTTGAANFTNAISGDNLGVATVVVNTSGQTSTSGNLTAGTHIGIQSISALSGADAGNYTFPGVVGNYTVTPLGIAITGISAANKVYDGTTLATLLGTAKVTVLGTDVVNIGGTGSGVFADANVGTAKSVTVSGFTLTGADANNYTAIQPTGLTANITAAPIILPPPSITPPVVSPIDTDHQWEVTHHEHNEDVHLPAEGQSKKTVHELTTEKDNSRTEHRKFVVLTQK